MKKLPCGHTPKEEHAIEIKRKLTHHLQFVEDLINDLRQNRLTLPSIQVSFEDQRIAVVKYHFDSLKKCLPNTEYQDQVKIYETALRERLKLCADNRASMPLIPQEVNDLIQKPGALPGRRLD